MPGQPSRREMTGPVVGKSMGHRVTSYSGGCLPTNRIRVGFYLRPVSFQQTLVLDASAPTAQVDRLLTDADVFDALAGQMVYVARQRGRPALSSDPGGLHRVDAALDVDLLQTTLALVGRSQWCAAGPGGGRH